MYKYEALPPQEYNLLTPLTLKLRIHLNIRHLRLHYLNNILTRSILFITFISRPDSFALSWTKNLS
jgi:hypothetical protein